MMYGWVGLVGARIKWVGDREIRNFAKKRHPTVGFALVDPTVSQRLTSSSEELPELV